MGLYIHTVILLEYMSTSKQTKKKRYVSGLNYAKIHVSMSVTEKRS